MPVAFFSGPEYQRLDQLAKTNNETLLLNPNLRAIIREAQRVMKQMREEYVKRRYFMRVICGFPRPPPEGASLSGQCENITPVYRGQELTVLSLWSDCDRSRS